jgi:predicted ATPase
MHGEALFELWTYHCVRGDFEACRALTEEFVPLAEAEHDRTLLLMADTVALVTYFCLAEFPAAQRHADRVHQLYRPDQDQELVRKLNHDPLVFASLYEGFWLWVQGRPDAAAQASRRAVEIARRLRHPFQLCFALCNGCVPFVLRREHDATFAQIHECIELAKEHRIPAFRVYAPLMGAPALVEREPTPALLARLNRCASAAFATEAGMHVPLYLIHLAEAHERVGDAKEAIPLLRRALDMVGRTGERWLEPELHRVLARSLRAQPDAGEQECETWLRSGLARARALHTRGFELRIACDLAELLQAQGRGSEGAKILEPIYATYSEGFDTKDLLHAKAILDRLTAGLPA